MIKRLIFITAVLHLISGCSLLPSVAPLSEEASLQIQRTAGTQDNLRELAEIDALIKLDNRWLSGQIEDSLLAQTSSSETYDIRRLKLNFGRQAILLDALMGINDGQGNTISASLSGEILLDFNGGQLEWFPLVHQFEINSRDFVFGDGIYAEPIPELHQQTLRGFDETVAQALVAQGNNVIPLDIVPLGDVTVGATLPGFTDAVAQQTRQLRGLSMVAGSAMLIDAQVTTLALDMAFIPDLSTCPANVTVSRAGFTHDVESREPVGIASSLGETAEVNHFYSEISGARQPLTIIHYWFADGLPMTVEELPVGQSARWRTWSDKGKAGSGASRWEVLVVEKESGCILHSQAIRTPEPELVLVPAKPGDAKRLFAELSDEFNRRTAGFSIAGDNPKFLLIEVTRPFLAGVLQASLMDLNLDVSFENPVMRPLRFEARLEPSAAQDIRCKYHDCPPQPVCQANLAQCKRLRDTRDCSSCKFRNPLNNRCVSEAIDPMCEASRKRQNARYDAERATCVANAETMKRECDELADQVQRSCDIESDFEESACEAVKSSLENLASGEPLALLSTQVTTSGTLAANFSNFRVGDNLGELKLDISLVPDLQLDGALKFNPADVAKPLADCIAAWNASFSSRIVTAPAVNNLLNDLEQSHDHLTANWSGFGLSTMMQPPPLKAVFVDNPQLLANCKIGLEPGLIEQAVNGTDSEFFSGSMELQVLPLPTTIRLAPATLILGERTYNAAAQLTPHHLRYAIGK